MSTHALESYRYESLSFSNSFRVIELLGGEEEDPISCSLRNVNWSNVPEYEAISYAWGDPNARVPVNCDGKRFEVTKNLYAALIHFRRQGKSRFLWADALW